MNANYITYLQSQSRSPLTIENYTKYINMALEYIGKPENEITYMDLVDWKNTFTNLKPNSQNIRISAVKSYFGFLKKAGIITSNPADELEKQKVRDCDVKQKPYIEAHYLRDMVNNARTIRDKAIILLFATTGLRVSELVGLTLKQYQDMKANGNNVIKITGKGNKERLVPFNQETQAAIDDYIKTRNMGTVHSDKLFLSHYGNDIARNNLSMTLKDIAKKAGIPFWNEICNHAMRSACASIYGEAGVPVANIRDLLGHSDLAVTSRYIKTSVEQVSSAVMNMSFC